MNTRFKELCRELGVVPDVALQILESEAENLARRDRLGVTSYGVADKAAALEAAAKLVKETQC